MWRIVLCYSAEWVVGSCDFARNIDSLFIDVMALQIVTSPSRGLYPVGWDCNVNNIHHHHHHKNKIDDLKFGAGGIFLLFSL